MHSLCSMIPAWLHSTGSSMETLKGGNKDAQKPLIASWRPC